MNCFLNLKIYFIKFKTEIVKFKNDIKAENEKGIKEVNEETDKINKDFDALKRELVVVKFYVGGMFFAFIGGCCIIFIAILELLNRIAKERK
ncbi:unnamed protein product [Meloidogyne enterolobii]|uniref:Uncharacterized protein n=1 Tax=Meloidogyne enterolobii TaxID=390850 RepID=A0ACB0Y474_MELEN